MLLAQRAPRPPARQPLPSQRQLFFVAAGLLIAGETIFWTVLAAVQSNSGVAALDAPVHDGLVASRNPLATAILTAVTTVTWHRQARHRQARQSPTPIACAITTAEAEDHACGWHDAG